MEKYNAGDTDDVEGRANLVLAVIGHTHKTRLVSRPKNNIVYYLLLLLNGLWAMGKRRARIRNCSWK